MSDFQKNSVFFLEVKLRLATLDDFKAHDQNWNLTGAWGLRFWLMDSQDRLELHKLTRETNKTELIMFIRAGRCYVIEEERL